MSLFPLAVVAHGHAEALAEGNLRPRKRTESADHDDFGDRIVRRRQQPADLLELDALDLLQDRPVEAHGACPRRILRLIFSPRPCLLVTVIQLKPKYDIITPR